MQAYDGLDSPIGRLSRWPATWLPSEVGSRSLSMTPIGTIARSVRLPCTDSARVISQLRIAPVMVARMTSLTVPPWNRRTLR